MGSGRRLHRARRQVEADLEAARRWVDFAGALSRGGGVDGLGHGDVRRRLATTSSPSPPRSTTARRRSGGRPASPSPCIPRRTTTRCSSPAPTTTGSSPCWSRGSGWVPDTGHILRGGQAIGDTLAAHRDRIRYVHLKDVDAAGTWAMLGEGRLRRAGGDRGRRGRRRASTAGSSWRRNWRPRPPTRPRPCGRIARPCASLVWAEGRLVRVWSRRYPLRDRRAHGLSVTGGTGNELAPVAGRWPPDRLTGTRGKDPTFRHDPGGVEAARSMGREA